MTLEGYASLGAMNIVRRVVMGAACVTSLVACDARQAATADAATGQATLEGGVNSGEAMVDGAPMQTPVDASVDSRARIGDSGGAANDESAACPGEAPAELLTACDPLGLMCSYGASPCT